MDTNNSPRLQSSRAWRNWGGNQHAQPRHVAEPENYQEVVELIQWAKGNEENIRVAATGHSFSPVVPTDGLMLHLEKLSGIVSVDRQARTVRLRAGSVLGSVVSEIWDAGLALENQGDIALQTIGGVVSTATHGSGLEFPSYSGMITALKLATADGSILEIDQSQPRLLDAARVSLGTLGPLLEVEFQMVDAYYLQRSAQIATWDETLAQLGPNTSQNRHYAFFWYPTSESARLFGEVAPETIAEGQLCFTLSANIAATDAPDQSAGIDRSYRSFEFEYPTPFVELEYYVAYEDTQLALNAVRDLILERFPGAPLPMEVRFVAAESGFMSPFHDRLTTVISVSSPTDYDWSTAFEAIDAALQEFSARAHWGKYNFMDAERLSLLYPAYEDFRSVRDELDPSGMFLNEYTRQLFG